MARMRKFPLWIPASALLLVAAAAAVQSEDRPEPPFRLLNPAGAGELPVTLVRHSRYSDGLVLEFAGPAPDRILVEGLLDERGRPLPPLAAGSDGRRVPIPPCVVAGTPSVILPEGTFDLAPRTVAGIWSVGPPVAAILLAVLFREVLLALLAGVWLGAAAIEGGAFQGFLRMLDRHIAGAATDGDHARIVMFSCILGGLVAMISRMGGLAAVVGALGKRDPTRRRSQLSAFFLGIFVFFDDYANALLVGNGVRPITDRARISREKLAYLVDSTSAPVACIAPISTWIAAQIGYVGDWMSSHGDKLVSYTKAYDVFLASIPYNFYPILALWFVFLVAFWGRDFGPMARAELRAAGEGKLLADGATPLASREMDEVEAADPARLRVINAVVPVGVLVAGVLAGLYLDGIGSVENREELAWFEVVRDAYGKAAATNVLLWASSLSLLSAWILALSQRLVPLKDAADTTLRGIKAMIPAVVVLILAWSLADICKTLNTSGYLVEQVAFSYRLLPVVTFLLAAAIAFSTGTSWGTMAILVPLALSYAVELGAGQPPEALERVVLASLGAVLAGAVFGDHCSPISDTTVMSSMAAGSDHLDHVKTQLPYALAVGGVAAVFGYLPAGFGVGPFLLLLAAGSVLVMMLWLAGRRTG